MINIKNGLIHTMEGDEPFVGSVYIKDGKIEEVVKGDSSRDGYEEVDAAGKMVFPGFIDAHCHLGLWEDAIGFEGADGNELTDPITPHLRAIDGINPMDRTFSEALTGGVTMAVTGPGSGNVIGGTFAAIKTAGRRVDEMIVKDPVAMKIAFGENPKRVYNSKGKSPTTRMAIAAELRNALYKAKEYVRKTETAKDDATKLPGFDMKMEALAKVIRKEIPLKAHAHRADDIFTALRIAKEFDLDITLDHCSEGHLIAKELKDENKSVIVGPSFGERTKFELKNLTFDTPGVLSKAGVKVAIMTDHPVVPLQHLGLMAALSVKSGMDEYEALKAITINAAEIVELSDRVGSLRAGKDADVVIWSGHPFELNSVVEKTYVNGNLSYETGK